MVSALRFLLAGALAVTILPSPSRAEWKPEPVSQSYVNLGCGADVGTVLLSINTGTTKYLLSSTSPLFKSASSITTKAVANDRRIRVYALTGFPTVRRNYTNENGTCSEMSGIDLLGIGFDVSSSTSTPAPQRPIPGLRIARNSGWLRIAGAVAPVELSTLDGRSLDRLRPDAQGSVSTPLVGLPRGLLLVRSGNTVVRLHNF